MQAVQSIHRLKIKGEYPIQELYDLQIIHELNNHSTMHLIGILKEKEAKDFIFSINQNEAIEIVLDEKVIFSGIPTEVSVECEHGVNYVCLEFKSCTYEMDITRYSRSFQDKKMTFDQLIGFISKGYKDGDFTNTGAPGKEIQKIRLQYNETDWEFLKRMASDEGTVLVPDITAAKPRFWFGIPKSKESIEVDRYDCYNLTQKAETIDKTENMYYEIEIQEHLSLGDEIIVNKIPFIITRSFIYLENSILLYKYILRQPDSIKTKLITNKRLQGISLPGKVIDVARNQLKVHLNIDPKQSVEKAYWFPYSAEANNVWYNMPHKGTNINVYFPDTEAAIGMAMTSTRGSGAEMQKNPNMSKPTEKIMETKWGKELRLKEDHINIDTGVMNVKLDEKNIEVVSNDKIFIKTDTDLNLGKTVTKAIVNGKETEVIKKTKNITIKTQELTTFKVSNTSSTVELDINNSLSSQLNVAMNGSLKAPMPLIKTKGQDVTEQAEEAAKAEAARKEQAAQRAGLGVGKLIGAALLGLAAVAVIGAATAMTGGLALAVLGPTLAPMAAVAMQVTGVALAAAAISDGIEGAQDIAYAAQGDLDSHSYNPLRDGVFGGDAEAYANFETGLMILAALELEFAAPFVMAQQVQAQANRQAMQKSRASARVGNGASGGKTLIVKEPKIFSKQNLTTEELNYYRKHFNIKKRALTRAAKNGQLKWSPNTDDIRISELQKSYRDAVSARYKRIFGKEPDLSRLNADHRVDLIVGGSPTQRLRMLDETINKSVGASLKQSGRKAGLKAGDIIDEIIFVPRGD